VRVKVTIRPISFSTQISIIGRFEIPVYCRSRESGNSEKSRRWIPAYAGMTGFSNFPIIAKGISCDAS
jgi:hypothetical protein